MAQQVFGKKLTDMSAERSTMAQQFPTVESLHPTEAMFDLLQEHASGYLRFAWRSVAPTPRVRRAASFLRRSPRFRTPWRRRRTSGTSG